MTLLMILVGVALFVAFGTAAWAVALRAKLKTLVEKFETDHAALVQPALDELAKMRQAVLDEIAKLRAEFGTQNQALQQRMNTVAILNKEAIARQPSPAPKAPAAKRARPARKKQPAARARRRA